MRDLRRQAHVIEFLGARNAFAPDRFGISSRPSGGGRMRQPIEVGQHYIKLEGISTVWEVVARIRDPGGVPHVRLRNVNDPSMTKLISEPTLRNHRFYRILESRAERIA